MMILSVADGLLFTSILTCLGIIGIFINGNNILAMLMSVELIMLAINTNLLIFSRYWQDLAGQILVFFVLIVAAIKIVIGLVLLMLLFKQAKPVTLEQMHRLKG